MHAPRVDSGSALHPPPKFNCIPFDKPLAKFIHLKGGGTGPVLAGPLFHGGPNILE